MKSLGSASSIPREGTPQTPLNKEAMRGGEAEPNNLWITLAERQETILRLRAERDADDVFLVFDSHDQARLA